MSYFSTIIETSSFLSPAEGQFLIFFLEVNTNFFPVLLPLILGHLYLVFEFMDTDLSRIIRSDQFMTKGHVQYILYQLLLGVKYMHSANVIHRYFYT